MPRRNEELTGPLTAYLRQIAKHPRLTHAEERALGARIQRDRDHAALSRLVESNLHFVVSYARRYRGYGVRLLDLIHRGNLGLVEAARRFDPTRDARFVSSAVWWIRQSMMHELVDRTQAIVFPATRTATRGGFDDLSLGVPRGSGDVPVAAAALRATASVRDDTPVPVVASHRSRVQLRQIRAGARNTERRTARLCSLLN